MGRRGSIGEPFWFLVSGHDASLRPQLTTLPAQSPEGASPKAPMMLQWRGSNICWFLENGQWGVAQDNCQISVPGGHW